MDELLKYVQGSTNPLDVVLKKDESNPLVQKVKYAINAIAEYRGTKELKVGGYEVEFPLYITDSFDDETYAIAQEYFPAFKSTGKMTVRIARKRWSFVAGYYDKAFPSALAEVTNYKELQDAYASGVISKAKQKRESIVENVLKALELLGASYINIVDQSGFLGEAGVTGTPVSASVNASHSKESLREKNFGKNPLKEKQAMEYVPKLEIMPKVVNLIKSRINSNLLSETLVENVSLGVGANLSVAGVGAKASFNMNRKLEIQVKFYDKTEL
jgi:hypothetical protein